ncbi:hypothetical protein VTN77DRAFT_1135 [Rasamsonia byssochlamydoides]|uniref:uncharacterized protein n=1 Tax=Rasamsonia byssochlamydoides TaxID=89139 RepID=UPI003743BC94
MAPLSKTLALAAAFAAFGSAAPLNKRYLDLVYETVTDVVWTTVDTTITIYPGEPTPTTTLVSTTSAVVAVTPTSSAAPAPAPVSQESFSTSSSSSAVEPSPVVTVPSIQVPQPSVTLAPQPTSTAAPEVTTTSTPEITSAPAPAPAPESATTTSSSLTSRSPEPSSSSSGGLCSESSPCSGRGTYYDTATSASNPSFCDTTNNGYEESVVALSSVIMSQEYCGKTITVEYNGQSTTALVVDKCPGCSEGSIDMSRKLFGDLASLDLGVIEVTWYFNN